MNTLRVLAVGDPAISVYTDKSVQGISSRWEYEFNAKVQYEVLPWEQYHSVVDSAVKERKETLDIIMVAGHLWLADFVESEIIIPLPDKLDQDILPNARRESLYKEKEYLVPSFSDGHLVFYRRDILGDLPAVMSPIDMVKAAMSAKRDVVAYPLALKAHRSEIFLDFLPYLRAYGEEPFDSEGRWVAHRKEVVDALNYYTGLRALTPFNVHTYGNEEVCRALQTGEVGMAVSWGGQAVTIVNGFSDTVREKVGFSTLTRPWNVNWSFAITAFSQQKEIAFSYLKYITGNNGDRKIGEVAGSPMRLATYLDNAENQVCPWYPSQLEMLNRAVPLPTFVGARKTLGVVYEHLFEAFVAKITPEQFYDRCDQDINKTS